LKSLLAKSPERAERLADELAAQANEALAELRSLARGIFPPLLADRGLAAAVRAQAERSGAVNLEVGPSLADARFAPEIEAAAYFCIREALQNAAKHAPGAAVAVTLGRDNGWLRFAVRDHGPGFVVEPGAKLDGSGLQGMRDRLAALGGELAIASSPGAGTSVRGRLPVPQTPAPVAAPQIAVSAPASSSLLDR
jgi:signal transduction histidine kinase